MEQADIETLIGELESRVDRLRSLYEQYFMGIEKLIPSVPHKDVERRFYVLRREQIRNTALRFRFQNVLLKYNTYQSYWTRICRQIEEGTYKRDVRRANARFSQPGQKGAEDEQAGQRRKRERDGDEVSVEQVEELDLDVEVDLDAEIQSFEDEELERAREEVAKMRATLRGKKEVAAPPVPVASTPGKRPTSLTSGGTYKSGKRRGSDLPPPLPVAPADQKLEAPFPSVPRPAPAPIVHERRPPQGPPKASPTLKAASAPAPVPVSAAPPPPARAAAAAAPAVTRPAGLSDERVRQIYTQYVEAKRKVGESTASLTYDNLARSLRDSTEKLKQKAGGKKVDFEVAIKDGKTILKPVLK